MTWRRRTCTLAGVIGAVRVSKRFEKFADLQEAGSIACESTTITGCASFGKREDYLATLGMRVNRLAGVLGVSAARLNEIVRGQRGVTADTALRLLLNAR